MKTITDVLSQDVVDSWLFTPIKKGKKAPIGFYGSWLNHPFPFEQALKIYVEGKINYTGIDRKTKRPIPGLVGTVGAIGVLCGPISGGLLLLDHDGHSCDHLLSEWGELPRTAKVSSGREGHYQLAFYVPEQFWDAIETYKEKTGVRDAQGKAEQVELRWEGCQSLVHGEHPESGNFYQWGDYSEIAEAPLFLIEKMLKQEEEEKPDPKPASFKPSINGVQWSDREWALSYLDAIRVSDLGWYEWRDCVLAAHEAGLNEVEVRRWSATSIHHTDRGFDDVWRHIKGSAKPVGLGTLGAQAKKDGWVSPFPKKENNSQEQLFFNPSPTPQQVDKLTTPEKLDFNVILDRVDELESDIKDDAELEWTVRNFAYETSLKQRGFSGPVLLNLARARRDAQDDLEIIDAQDLLGMQDQGREWTIAAVLPRSTVMIVASTGGTGKTTLGYQWAKHIALGIPWSGYRVKQGHVVVVQSDELKPDISDKLDICQYWDVPRGLVTFVCGWRATQFRQLERVIEEKKPEFLFVDSYTAIHAGTGIDLTASTGGDTIYKLNKIATRYSCTVVVIHHFNKLNELRDTGTIHDNASEVRKLYPDKELGKNQFVFEAIKSRSGLSGKYVLRRNPLDYSWEHEGLYDGVDTRMEAVTSHISDNSDRTFTVKDICEVQGLPYDHAELTLEQCRRLGLITAEWVVHQRHDGTVGRFRVYKAIEAQIIEQEEIIWEGAR